MKTETGRTLLEILAVLSLIGLLSVSGLRFFGRATSSVRVNYLMQQVFMKANELVTNPVANRRRSVDISMNTTNKLSYGYSFDEVKNENGIISVKLTGKFSEGMCRLFKEKLSSNEYAGLNKILAGEKNIANNDCPDEISEMSFEMNADFRPTKKAKKVSELTYTSKKTSWEKNGQKPEGSCNLEGALSCDPLVCNKEDGWFEFEDAPGHCEHCSAGFFCTD